MNEAEIRAELIDQKLKTYGCKLMKSLFVKPTINNNTYERTTIERAFK
jgi:hypothetical protein